jgi:hypothetical protein
MKSARVLLASLLIILTSVSASPAQAAACSAKDIKIWEQSNDPVPSFKLAYAFAALKEAEYIEWIFTNVPVWKKSTKSKSLKTALTKFEKAFEIHAGSDRRYSTIPELHNAYTALNTIFKFKRC